MSTLRLIRAGAQLDAAGTTELKDAVGGTATAGLLVQSYCTQVAQQPAILIPQSLISKLPPINDYLKTARDHASDYLTNVQPLIITVVTDVGGYATEFVNFNGLITSRIDAWRGGSATARTEALALLEQLEKDLRAKLTNITKVNADIGRFQNDLNNDVSNFKTALEQANAVVKGDKGVLKELERQISDMDDRITGAAVGVALSGLTVVAGGLMIATGAIATLFTAGTSTPLVLAGVAVVVVGGAGLTASSLMLANLIDAKAALLQQRAQLKANLKFLTDFNATLGTLNTSATMASGQLTKMSNAWTALGGHLNNVVGSVKNAQTFSDLPILVQAFLDTAGGQWASVLESVRIIQVQLTGVETRVLRGPNGLAPLNKRSLEALAA